MERMQKKAGTGMNLKRKWKESGTRTRKKMERNWIETGTGKNMKWKWKKLDT